MKNRKTYFKIQIDYNYSYPIWTYQSPFWLRDIYKSWRIICMNSEEEGSAVKKKKINKKCKV